MTSAGSPEIQNLIPIQYLIDEATKQPLTDARAGWPVSIIVALFMFAVGQWYLERVLRRAVADGERFEARDGDHVATQADSRRPSFIVAITPLVVTLLALNLLPFACHQLANFV
ncbi:MAG: hypothetical protein FD138_3211, partial [Planctomycetota bacterium]